MLSGGCKGWLEFWLRRMSGWLGAGRSEDKEVRQQGTEQGQLCDQGVIWTPLHSCHSESGHNGGAGGGGPVVGSVAVPLTCTGNV